MTQNGRLLNYLETHSNGITQLESFNTLGIARLSERIRELEALGYRISHTPEVTSTGARVIRYRLLKAGEAKVTHYKSMVIVENPPLSQSAPILNSDPDSVTKWQGTPIIDAAPSATDAVMVTRYYVKDGREVSYQYLVSGYANGKVAR